MQPPLGSAASLYLLSSLSHTCSPHSQDGRGPSTPSVTSLPPPPISPGSQRQSQAATGSFLPAAPQTVPRNRSHPLQRLCFFSQLNHPTPLWRSKVPLRGPSIPPPTQEARDFVFCLLVLGTEQEKTEAFIEYLQCAGPFHKGRPKYGSQQISMVSSQLTEKETGTSEEERASEQSRHRRAK